MSWKLFVNFKRTTFIWRSLAEKLGEQSAAKLRAAREKPEVRESGNLCE